MKNRLALAKKRLRRGLRAIWLAAPSAARQIALRPPPDPIFWWARHGSGCCVKTSSGLGKFPTKPGGREQNQGGREIQIS